MTWLGNFILTHRALSIAAAILFVSIIDKGPWA